MTERHAIAWAHGMASVQALGGMLGPVNLPFCPTGGKVSPLHVAPWFDDPDRTAQPPILQDLRGEWPCIPFGTDAPRALPEGWSATGETFDGAGVPHGHSSNAEWVFTKTDASRIELTCDYPETHPIRRLTRTINADPDAPRPRHHPHRRSPAAPATCPLACTPPCRLPTTGTARLHPPAFREGRIFPLDVEPGLGLLPTRRDLLHPRHHPPPHWRHALPVGPPPDRRHRGTRPALRRHRRLPPAPPPTAGPSPWTGTPSTSPRSSSGSPTGAAPTPPGTAATSPSWVEPVCAAFDLGPAVSTAPNPISTAGHPHRPRLPPRRTVHHKLPHRSHLMTPIYTFGGQPARRNLTLRDLREAKAEVRKLTQANATRDIAEEAAAVAASGIDPPLRHLAPLRRSPRRSTRPVHYRHHWCGAPRHPRRGPARGLPRRHRRGRLQSTPSAACP